MHREFTNSQREPIFAPEKLKKFCTVNGAPTIFETLLAAMTDDRHSEKRIQSNRKRVVEIIYKLCFGKSQKCNYLQKANGFYLNMNHLSSEGKIVENIYLNSICFWS